MQIASLGSGSKGNATLVRAGDCTLLIDCGFSLKQFSSRLARLNISVESINAILLTHEHGDHSSGIIRLAQNYNIPVWCTVGTAKEVFDEHFSFNPVSGGKTFEMKPFEIMPVTVPHDAREPVQFVITDQSSGQKLGVLTDTGHISSHILEAFDDLNGLLLEFNYDEQMLSGGPYPYPLKQRVGGQLGHLSNLQSSQMLQEINKSRLSCLIAGHISEKNNSRTIVKQALENIEGIPQPILACQEDGFNWISV